MRNRIQVSPTQVAYRERPWATVMPAVWAEPYYVTARSPFAERGVQTQTWRRPTGTSTHRRESGVHSSVA